MSRTILSRHFDYIIDISWIIRYPREKRRHHYPRWNTVLCQIPHGLHSRLRAGCTRFHLPSNNIVWDPDTKRNSDVSLFTQCHDNIQISFDQNPLSGYISWFLNSASAFRVFLVTSNRPSAGSYESEAISITMGSPYHLSFSNSCLRTWGALVLANIS